MIGRWIGIVFGCTMLGLVVGLLVGFLMSVVAPGFAVALIGDRVRDVPAVELCLGLGIANGPILGLIGGVSIVIAESILKSRKPAT